MNSKNLNRVADAIEKGSIRELGYNQYSWVADDLKDMSGRGCGTTSCIAGWAYAVKRGRHPEDDTMDIFEVAKDFLQLSLFEANCLFGACPPISDGFESISVEQAVKALRYAAKHHVIDWVSAQTEVFS